MEFLVWCEGQVKEKKKIENHPLRDSASAKETKGGQENPTLKPK